LFSLLPFEKKLGNLFTPALILRRGQRLVLFLFVLVVNRAETIVRILDFMLSLGMFSFNLPNTFLVER